ncbi:MAG: hypothetical protein FJY97_18490 [candidate division Zixibacteria bacterium]|nr:hypothetical protein [candidate division Zixibacteria bacterium]
MRYLASMETGSYTVGLEERDETLHVEIDGNPLSIDLIAVDGNGLYSLLVGNRSHTAVLLDTTERFRVEIDGVAFDMDIEQEDLARLWQSVKRKAHAGGEQIKAPMPGRVIAVEATVGDVVTPGKGVIVIEAMKMENELRAHAGGVVKEVRVKVGDPVNKNDVLMMLGAQTGE